MAMTSINVPLSIGDPQLCPLPEDGSPCHVAVAAKTRIERNNATHSGTRQPIVQAASRTVALCT